MNYSNYVTYVALLKEYKCYTGKRLLIVERKVNLFTLVLVKERIVEDRRPQKILDIAPKEKGRVFEN